MKFSQLRSLALCSALSVASIFMVNCSRGGPLSAESHPTPLSATESTSRAESMAKIPAANNPKVVDQNGNPLVGAQILIGVDVNQPFPNNYISTDAVGSFVAPPDWTSEQAVTISAPGFVRATYLRQRPMGQTFAIRKLDSGKAYQIAGTTLGHQTKDFDGYVDFGLIIPGIRRQAFFNFDVTDFISPESDPISVLGRTMNIPSNITLPPQREAYDVIIDLNIDLNKPTYHMRLKNEGPQTFFAARGKFPLKEVVDAYQAGREVFELVNFFNIEGGSIREINVSGNNSKEDWHVDEVTFKDKKKIQGPQLKTDEMALAAALTPRKGVYYPTDVKYLESGKSQDLVTDSPSSASLLSILRRKSESKAKTLTHRLSAAFQPLSAGATPQFLPLMENPTVISPLNLKIPTVATTGNIYKGGVYAVLSHVKKVTVGSRTLDVVASIWEVYGPAWESQLQLPSWPNESAPSGNLRWQVTLTGVVDQNSLQNVELGPQWLETATHATQSAADF